MSTNKRTGGLGGVKAFTTPASASPTKPAKTTDQKEPAEPKIEKARTTVMLYPATLAALDQLKSELRKSGEKATYSDVLEQAIWALMEKKGLKT